MVRRMDGYLASVERHPDMSLETDVDVDSFPKIC